MDHRPRHNGHFPFTRISEDVVDVAVSQDLIIAREEIGLFKDENGKEFRRIRTVRKVARRTFLTGKLKGKYWGYPSETKDRRKDIGDFYDITIYESVFFVDKCDIKTDREISYRELITETSRKHSCQSQQIHFEQISENILVVQDHESVQRYKMDLHEPALFNPRLLHSMHQSNGTEVFGTIESHICGYLVDSVIKVEETVEEVEKNLESVETTSVTTQPEKEDFGTTQDTGEPPIPPKPPKSSKPSEWEWGLRHKESILFLLLFGLAVILILVKSPLPAILVAVGTLLLLFCLPIWRSRLPWWLLAAFALFFGLLLWNSFKSNQPIIEGLSSLGGASKSQGTAIDGNRGAKAGQQGADNLIKPERESIDDLGQSATGGKRVDSANSNRSTTPKISAGAEAVNSPSKTTDTPEPIASPASKEQVTSFEMYLNRGLKAVEDEEYELANQNFRQAARLSPGHPRLRSLADSYKAVADQKCEQFKRANAKGLSYIPNNYYQYAASLTQTVPLKCD
ncbi:hypothetical protein SAMN05216327_1208 [Dyadobacter sp. SG02]|uniref:ArnT family glycosyltransferase n=1 Tax=Dyadobacter sp. SG02 TaxID=1855291 RepID=UPI0008D15A3E|nr:energy-coupling factor transporter transmembrane component T [Dyadobacter sp. SG02]SEJ78845.1 hypothetical protein SAMN05216327_1208 [Dyadobacter sp. SG02]